MSACEDDTARVISSIGPTNPVNLSLDRLRFIILVCNISSNSLPIVVWWHGTPDLEPIISGALSGPRTIYGRRPVFT